MTPFSDLLRYLQSNSIPFVVDGIPSVPTGFEPRALSALADVRRVRVTPVQVNRQVWLAIVDETRQLQPEMVRRVFGGRLITRVHDEDLSLLFPGCQTAAIPPLGNLFGVPVMLDESLSDAPAVSFAAFAPEVSVVMRTADLRALANPVVAEIATSARVSVPQP
jgi:Ala-tRNA(Pro) deacylase